MSTNKHCAINYYADMLIGTSSSNKFLEIELWNEENATRITKFY